MSEDNDLRRMFDAQREMDQKFAPSFDEIRGESAIRQAPLPTRRPAPVTVLACALSLLILVGVIVWSRLGSQTDQVSAITTQVPVELQHLNRVCDSMLLTIQNVEFSDSTQTTRETADEIEWPTVTKSLLPFDSLALHTRNQP